MTPGRKDLIWIRFITNEMENFLFSENGHVDRSICDGALLTFIVRRWHHIFECQSVADVNPLFNQQGKPDHSHVTADVPCRRWCDLSADLLIALEVWKGCGMPLRETGYGGGVMVLWTGGEV